MPAQVISKSFGAAVRNRRIQSGITQEVLAERAGLHATYIGMVERGVRNPTLDVAARIAKGLKVDLAGLIQEALSIKAGAGRKA